MKNQSANHLRIGVVTSDRSSLKDILEDILLVIEEGLSWKVYDPIWATSLWWWDASKRLGEEKGSRTYRMDSPV